MPSLNIIGVKIQEISRVQYFDAGLLELSLGDEVIVETGRGIEMGVVTSGPHDPLTPEELEKLTRVIRLATEKDRERLLENREEARNAYHVAKEKVQEHDLPMSLVSTEYLFDRSKYIFYFTAENRVDFRDLVRDLASTLHCRVELWQIGARDETKFYGGLGICGRTLCCNTFLKEFAPVTIKMAKDQSLALNPLKISGICGRLMCCLRYEHETYREARAHLPHEGAAVFTPQGRGRVVELNALKDTVTVELENEALLECLADEVWLPGERPDQEKILEEAARAAEKPERSHPGKTGDRNQPRNERRENGEKEASRDESRENGDRGSPEREPREKETKSQEPRGRQPGKEQTNRDPIVRSEHLHSLQPGAHGSNRVLPSSTLTSETQPAKAPQALSEKMARPEPGETERRKRRRGHHRRGSGKRESENGSSPDTETNEG